MNDNSRYLKIIWFWVNSNKPINFYPCDLRDTTLYPGKTSLQISEFETLPGWFTYGEDLNITYRHISPHTTLCMSQDEKYLPICKNILSTQCSFDRVTRWLFNPDYLLMYNYFFTENLFVHSEWYWKYSDLRYSMQLPLIENASGHSKTFCQAIHQASIASINPIQKSLIESVLAQVIKMNGIYFFPLIALMILSKTYSIRFCSSVGGQCLYNHNLIHHEVFSRAKINPLNHVDPLLIYAKAFYPIDEEEIIV